MKRIHIIWCVLVCVVASATGLSSCRKIDLSESGDDDGGSGGTPVVVRPDTIPEGDSGEDIKDFNTIAQALKLPSDTFVSVRGYVVGGILNNKRIYGTDFSAPNSALLLADSPNETVASHTFAIALKTGQEGLRDVLNLYDYPEWLGRMIQVRGLIKKYYGRNGINYPESEFYWLQPGSGDSGSGGDSGNQGGDSGGSDVGGGDSGKPSTPAPPALKDSLGHVEDGR